MSAPAPGSRAESLLERVLREQFAARRADPRAGWEAWRLVLDLERAGQLDAEQVARLAVWLERAGQCEVEALIDELKVEVGP